MTKKREPIDLVGRLATRLNLAANEPAPETSPSVAPPLVMRTGTVAPTPPAPMPEPRIVGRDPRIEPSLMRAPTETSPREPASSIRRAMPRPELVQQAAPTPAQVAAVHAEASRPIDGAHVSAPTLTEDGVGELPSANDDVATDAVATDAAARDSVGRKQVDLNLVRLHKEGFLTPQNQRSLIAEEYRIIKRPLLRAAFDHVNDPGNLNHVVMITSARPDEGKTFTAINLSMSVAAERDLFVLVVDCDIRRMGLSKKLGVADRKGLMDVLIDPTLSIADVLLRTNIPNLAIIPAGQPVEAATEVFASAKMTALVDDLATRYHDRFIIFDAPPVLASSEPGVLAVHVGQTVMVVNANETSKRAIAQSIPLINGCPNVHFVLNRATLAAGPERFGYYGTY